MLYSETHNFVFIPIAKCAGSSINLALSPYCVRFSHKKWDKLLCLLPYKRNPAAIYNRGHASANWLRQRLGYERYDKALTFCVVRNPYDRLVSRYENIRSATSHHRHRIVQQQSFNQFVAEEYSSGRLKRQSQLRQICSPDGQLLVKRLLRFENLDQEFSKLLVDLGVDHLVQLPRINSFRKNGEYRDYYSDETRALVQGALAEEFKYFGYEF